MIYKSRDGAPIEIEAMKYIVTREIQCKFGVHKDTNSMDIAEWMRRILHEGCFPNGKPEGRTCLEIDTQDGPLYADLGDYIVKDYSKDGFFPCVGEIFESEYEPFE